MTNDASQDQAVLELLDAAAHAMASPLGAITNYLYVLRGQTDGMFGSRARGDERDR